MRGLEAKLKLWQERQFISPEQYAKIIEFENQQPQRSWVSFGAAAVGVIALMTGVISIVAANWDGISPFTKIGLFFLIQASLGLGIWKLRDTTGLARELLISIFALWILGGIGLFGQIFHIESDGWRGMRAWLVMSLPIVLFARSKLINHLWIVGFGTTTALWLSLPPPVGLDSPGMFREMTFRVTFAGCLLYLLLALGVLRTDKISRWFLDAARTWALLVILFPMAISINMAWAFGSPIDEKFPVEHLGLVLLGALLALASLGVLPFGSKDRPRWAPWMASLVIVSFIGMLIPMTMQLRSASFVGLLFFLALWVCAAGAAAEADRKRLFDLATLVVSIRLIVAYFELFGSLAATGIGLIVTGLFIIAIALGWNKVRKLFLVNTGSKA